MKCVVLALSALVALSAAQLQKEPIAIVKLSSDVQPDGGFVYEYETANGIKAEARGQPSAAGPEGPAIAVQGQFAYVADDGQTYSVQYVADENGYQPQGAHLPTPPPIPEAILRSLEFNAKNYKGEDEQPQQQQQQAFKPARAFGRRR
ncbi:larval cuticle protein 65Ag1-like [Frankliniella occidentalis]|uniref:Larval cuticle protein 65Ag1-like n=1 Tax=Frankliniella occidentalis TaxID=133901 RepID=A0A6J1S528_FRAOC|nr:larval cuticle protein 65Ag1-like [Frankliniella occidentalis]